MKFTSMKLYEFQSESLNRFNFSKKKNKKMAEKNKMRFIRFGLTKEKFGERKIKKKKTNEIFLQQR